MKKCCRWRSGKMLYDVLMRLFIKVDGFRAQPESHD
jgi:hypothetical protein